VARTCLLDQQSEGLNTKKLKNKDYEEGGRKTISLLEGPQASPARPSVKNSIMNEIVRKENVKIVTLADDIRSLLSCTIYSYCCVEVVCSNLQRLTLHGGQPDKRV